MSNPTGANDALIDDLCVVLGKSVMPSWRGDTVGEILAVLKKHHCLPDERNLSYVRPSYYAPNESLTQ